MLFFSHNVWIHLKGGNINFIDRIPFLSDTFFFKKGLCKVYDCPTVKKYNKINKETTYSFSFSSSPKDMLIDFREKGREGEEH